MQFQAACQWASPSLIAKIIIIRAVDDNILLLRLLPRRRHLWFELASRCGGVWLCRSHTPISTDDCTETTYRFRTMASSPRCNDLPALASRFAILFVCGCMHFSCSLRFARLLQRGCISASFAGTGTPGQLKACVFLFVTFTSSAASASLQVACPCSQRTPPLLLAHDMGGAAGEGLRNDGVEFASNADDDQYSERITGTLWTTDLLLNHVNAATVNLSDPAATIDMIDACCFGILRQKAAEIPCCECQIWTDVCSTYAQPFSTAC